MNKAGLRYREVQSIWGKVSLPKQGYHCKECGYHRRGFVEKGMDSSGVLPEALKRAVKLVSKVDFAEATDLLNDWGLEISKSSLERLSQRYGESAWEQAQQHCDELSCQMLPRSKKPQRFVMETDGCFVLERDKTGKGGLEGREVKSIIIYPLNAPSQRVSLSSAVPIAEFRLLAQGLLRQAGVCQEDICLGLGDGAAWVRDLLEELGVVHVLLDVFHATSYLETLLKTLGCSEEARLEERKRWLRGEVDGAQYLEQLQADYNLTSDCLERLSSEGQTAWKYLNNHAQQGALDYPRFKDEGWVIGSGQIEGYNKWAILERMRGSGMHWSKQGLNRMAFLRSDFASNKPLTDFHQVRMQAFLTSFTFPFPFA